MTKNPWKIPLYLLLFGVLTVFGVLFKNFGTHTYSADEVRGGEVNLEVFAQPETGRQPILDAINFAEKEILVEVYLLSDKQLIDSLIEAKNRGIKVQIMIEQHPFGGGSINKTTASRLRSEGVEFKWTNPTFALTHEKVIIVDKKVAFILNQNLTQSSFKSNREFNIVDHNLTDVTELVEIFQADWNRSGYSPTAPNLVISPDNSRAKLSALIGLAENSLDLELEIINDRDIIKLLGQKSKEVEVRVILPDFKKIPSNQKGAEVLKMEGAQIRTISRPHIHSKLIVADRRRAYVGSVNMSEASMDQNREVGILVSQVDIVDKLNLWFEEDWEMGREF